MPSCYRTIKGRIEFIKIAKSKVSKTNEIHSTKSSPSSDAYYFPRARKIPVIISKLSTGLAALYDWPKTFLIADLQ